jgi:hypothetical protein
MHDIAMLIQYPDHWCEVISDDLAAAECLVEELVSHVLSTLFQVVLIEDVSLLFPHPHAHQDALTTLSLHALGCDPLPLVAHKRLDYIIEERLSRALVELFGSLNVERFAVC